MKFFLWSMLVAMCVELSAARIVQNYVQLCRMGAIYKKHPKKIISTLVTRKNWHEQQGGSKNLQKAAVIDAFLKAGHAKLSDAPACAKLLNEFDTAAGGAQMYASITHKDCENSLAFVNEKVSCMQGFVLGKRACHSAHDHQSRYNNVDLKALGWRNSRENIRNFIDDVVIRCPHCMSNILSKK